MKLLHRSEGMLLTTEFISSLALLDKNWFVIPSPHEKTPCFKSSDTTESFQRMAKFLCIVFVCLFAFCFFTMTKGQACKKGLFGCLNVFTLPSRSFHIFSWWRWSLLLKCFVPKCTFYEPEGSKGRWATIVEDSCIYRSWNPRPLLCCECRRSLHHLLLFIVPKCCTQEKTKQTSVSLFSCPHTT